MRTAITDPPPRASLAGPRDLPVWLCTQRDRFPPGTWVSASVPWAGAASAPLRAFPTSTAFSFRGRTGERHCGAGAAATLALGDGGLPALRHAAEQIQRNLVVLTPGPAPRLFGGLAFGRAGTGAWGSFGRGAFTLPRWSVVRAPDGPARLLLTVRAGALDSLDELQGELDQLLLCAATGPSRPVQVVEERPLDPDAWARLVGAAQQAIASGKYEKLVAARATVVRAAQTIDAVDVAERMEREHPHCASFLFRQPSATFVGSSPETLIDLRGGVLATHALAGSRRVAPDASDGPLLLNSSKDRTEHDIVVRAIVRNLRPFATRIDVPDLPTTRRVRDIVHLDTPIRAEIRRGVHALDLVEALHPTPAVGGVPRLDAVDWIEAHEPLSRGWYAGLVGWLGSQGEAELAVAIRSALISGVEATLFAGAGIVAQSDASAEYEETELKMNPVRRAFGGQG